jgi:hypothetical protein
MKKLWIFLALLVLLASACKTDQTSPTPKPERATASPAVVVEASVTPSPEPSATPTITPILPTETSLPTATPAPYGPDNFPSNVNPLTGTILDDPTLLNRRPIGIKINIFPRFQYRPPWGLSLSDIVYEFYHNDGYTRFHALIYGNDAELAGAIRSGRLLDEDLVYMYKSIFVYGGADERIDTKFWNSTFWDRLVREGVEINCPPTVTAPLCRYDPSGNSNLLAGTKEVHQYIQNKGVDDSIQNLNGMLFDVTLPAGGKDVSQVTTRYSTDVYNRWEYDPATGNYLRMQDAQQDTGQGESYEPLIDRVTEKQITAENIVVVFAEHQDILASTNAEIIDITLEGTGKAYAFRDGQVYEVQWNRPAQDSVLYLTFPDGTRFPFKPGITWFQIVGLNSTMQVETDGGYRFSFMMP